jgi:hypothetical protein
MDAAEVIACLALVAGDQTAEVAEPGEERVDLPAPRRWMMWSWHPSFPGPTWTTSRGQRTLTVQPIPADRHAPSALGE